jgi:hypothetical protein
MRPVVVNLLRSVIPDAVILHAATLLDVSNPPDAVTSPILINVLIVAEFDTVRLQATLASPKTCRTDFCALLIPTARLLLNVQCRDTTSSSPIARICVLENATPCSDAKIREDIQHVTYYRTMTVKL